MRLVTFLPLQHGFHQRAQPFPSIFNRFAHFEGSEFRFLPRAILHSVHIERQNFFFSFALHLLVKTLSGLVAEPAAPGHLFHEGRDFVAFPRLVFGRRLIYVLDHVHQHIEPYNIRGAKRRRLRPAHRRSRAGVYLFHCHAQRAHEAQRIQHGKRSDAIGYEVWRIFGHHHAFSETPVTKLAQRFDHFD